MPKADEEPITIRDLCPDLTEELLEAEEAFDAYLDIASRVYDRIRNDPAEYAKFKGLLATMRAEEEIERMPDQGRLF